jgi:hypothetical protein
MGYSKIVTPLFLPNRKKIVRRQQKKQISSAKIDLLPQKKEDISSQMRSVAIILSNYIKQKSKTKNRSKRKSKHETS